ncbi:BirA family transcriptional regulator, biotin operon repressor / biotin-[acetyl-CoA-carboxylase] ligase [Catalinimonas alkaloidigena]|uniref:BirA family transcriptional regulator, biotin operon repressor / biotin-[acetyl-CoA-carboxylase] ligase n=1 Tax=Catalinimonas alkaloidigena TaxID=1075417 RepID=A0A1G9LXF4_9BACT|nr:biotin--[acetyl-CoA-carboxylase] ligase [Catalinimonas alkaloidigena]SDL66593.1 BirA family transcriptional regulator, biotin operon repressor / biotin-[acetyl-CoA-carboxylase] ligase [Catalinimonas alkaloidigena]
MNNIPANTVFIGHHRLNLPSCHSTNDECALLLQQGKAFEGTLISTDHQTAGRGQRGNQWESAANQNLTFSVVLLPTFLRADEQFLLSMAVAVGVREGLARLDHPALDPAALSVKWPNDIYYQDQKLGGLLLENTVRQVSLQHTIAGIGLNVNQANFAVAKATSLFLLTGTAWDREEVLQSVVQGVERQYLQLRNGQRDTLRAHYLRHLYRYQEVHRFRETDGRTFAGEVVGVSPQGHLVIREETQLRRFGMKEIEFLD